MGCLGEEVCFKPNVRERIAVKLVLVIMKMQ